MSAPFLDQLVDWQAFEEFVRELYARDSNVVAERNVTEIGRSGAARQIDVKLTQVVEGHPEVTLVECKRWKAKVDRQRVDVLAASVEDLDAARGVMFTTSGYEAGAEAYAKHKGIEIFVVRDLTDDEWGQPGRVVWFYLHYYGSSTFNVNPDTPQLLSIVDNPPSRINLDLIIGKDQPHDPSLTLYSVHDGSPGPNLVSLVIEARSRTLELLSHSIEAWDTEAQGDVRAFLIPLKLDFSGQPHRQLLRSYGAVRLETLAMDLLVTVSQDRFELDRGRSLDLALAVENYVTRHRQVVARRGDAKDLMVFEGTDEDPARDSDDPEVLRNGCLFKVIMEAWVTPPKVKVTEADRAANVTFRLPDWEVSVERPPGPERVSPTRP